MGSKWIRWEHIRLRYSKLNIVSINPFQQSRGCRDWSKAPDWGSSPVGVRGFKSHPLHSKFSQNCFSIRFLGLVKNRCYLVMIREYFSCSLYSNAVAMEYQEFYSGAETGGQAQGREWPRANLSDHYWSMSFWIGSFMERLKLYSCRKGSATIACNLENENRQSIKELA